MPRLAPKIRWMPRGPARWPPSVAKPWLWVGVLGCLSAGCDGGLPSTLFGSGVDGGARSQVPDGPVIADGGHPALDGGHPADAGRGCAPDPDQDGYGSGPSCVGPDCDETRAGPTRDCRAVAVTGRIELRPPVAAPGPVAAQIGDGRFDIDAADFRLHPVGGDRRVAEFQGPPSYFPVTRTWPEPAGDRAELGPSPSRATARSAPTGRAKGLRSPTETPP